MASIPDKMRFLPLALSVWVYFNVAEVTDGSCHVLNTCTYQGFVVDIGKSADISCQRCTCEDVDYMICCGLGHIIVHHPPECKVISEGCSEKAVLISNPDVLCDHDIAIIGR